MSSFRQFKTYRVRCRTCKKVVDNKDAWGRWCRPCAKKVQEKKKKERELEK